MLDIMAAVARIVVERLYVAAIFQIPANVFDLLDIVDPRYARLDGSDAGMRFAHFLLGILMVTIRQDDQTDQGKGGDNWGQDAQKNSLPPVLMTIACTWRE